MPSSTPFVDPETGLLDREQIRREAEPLAKLIGLSVAVALVPFFVAFLLGPSPIALLFSLVGQFVLAVGAALTLMYVIARAIALSNDETAHASVRRPPGEGRTSGRDEGIDDEPDDAGDESNGDVDESEDE
jgi:hypothetical protein